MRQHVQINREGQLLLEKLNAASLSNLRMVVSGIQGTRRSASHMSHATCVQRIIEWMGSDAQGFVIQVEEALINHGL